MGRSVRDILATYTARRNRLDPLHAAALVVRDAYYGDIVLATPEQDRADRPLVANLLYQGGEQRAMRVASTTPDIYYPSTKPGTELRDKQARERRMTNLAWWRDDRMRLKMRKRARYLVYYAACPAVIRPDHKRDRPTWQIRNPLCMFPPEMDVGDLCPEDVIFTLRKSYQWIEYCYPEKVRRLNTSGNTARSFTLLEYIDGDEYVLAVIGDKKDAVPAYTSDPAPHNTEDGEIVELERVPNKVGRCTAVLPGRIGLEAARGEFDGVVGLWQAQAKLMALEVIGLQRAIWPEQWLVHRPGETAQIITTADPLAGITGEVTGGELKHIQPLPAAFATNMIDRLERAQRIDAGVPAELGGESTSNIRTGRRGDAVLSAVLDFPIQEEHELLEVALEEENRLAVATDKAYFNKPKTVFISSTAGEIEYRPSELWTTDRCTVRYAHAGVDAQGLIVEMGQRVGMGTMSLRSAMEMDPLVEDPQSEEDRIMLERIRAGLLQSVAQMSADPALAPVVAEITKKLAGKDTNIEDAVIQIQQAIQQQQAASAQTPPQAMPQEMPGMASPIPGPTEGQDNLASLLSQLHIGTQAANSSPTPTLQAV